MAKLTGALPYSTFQTPSMNRGGHRERWRKSAKDAADPLEVDPGLGPLPRRDPCSPPRTEPPSAGGIAVRERHLHPRMRPAHARLEGFPGSPCRAPRNASPRRSTGWPSGHHRHPPPGFHQAEAQASGLVPRRSQGPDAGSPSRRDRAAQSGHAAGAPAWLSYIRAGRRRLACRHRTSGPDAARSPSAGRSSRKPPRDSERHRCPDLTRFLMQVNDSHPTVVLYWACQY